MDANLNVGETVPPMMMTQDDQVQNEMPVDFDTVCTALRHGCINSVVHSVYPVLIHRKSKYLCRTALFVWLFAFVEEASTAVVKDHSSYLRYGLVYPR